MRSFLSQVDCRIELEQTFVPNRQREQDAFLMDLALAHTTSSTDLKVINACCLYLGATFVSDISTPEGSKITRAAYDGRMDILTQHRGLIPYQRRPGPQSWTKWRKFLNSLLSSTQYRRLAQPLGKWYFGGSSTFWNWLSYLDRPSSRLFVSAPNGQWLEYHYHGMAFWPTTTLHHSVPSAACPAQTLSTGPAKILSTSHYVLPRPITPPPSTLSEHMAQLTSWERSLCTQCTALCSTEALATFLQSPSALLVSRDGSAGSFVGSFGCVCSTDTGQRLFRLHGPAPGYKTSSFRAESYAFLAILRYLIQACLFLSCPLPTSLQMFTDSESLVKTIQKRLEWLVEFPYSTMTADWDLQQAISRSLRQFAELPHICHIKGHQDQAQAYSTLPLPAQLNVDADHAAAEYSYPLRVSSCLAPITAGSHALLHSADGSINSNYRAILRRLASYETLRQYHCSKYDWSEDVFNSVDWTAHGRALNSNFPRRHFLIKFLHDWLPLGYLKSRYAAYYDDTCPLCSNTLETRSHFFNVPNGTGSILSLKIFGRNGMTWSLILFFALCFWHFSVRFSTTPTHPFPLFLMRINGLSSHNLPSDMSNCFLAVSLLNGRISKTLTYNAFPSLPHSSPAFVSSLLLSILSGFTCSTSGSAVIRIFMAILPKLSRLPSMPKQNVKFSPLCPQRPSPGF